MAAITWTDVTDEAPELAVGITVNAQTALLDYVNTKLVVSGYDGESGRKSFLARVYLAAHMATLIKRRGLAGTKTSQSAGPVAESFAPIQLPRLGTYATTSYGLLFETVSTSSAHRAGLLLGGRTSKVFGL